MPKWPTKGQSVSAIHQGHQQEDQQSMHWVCRRSYFQKYPKEIPYKSEGKTRYDGCEWCYVLNSMCRMLSKLCWRHWEDAESPYGRAQKRAQATTTQDLIAMRSNIHVSEIH